MAQKVWRAEPSALFGVATLAAGAKHISKRVDFAIDAVKL